MMMACCASCDVTTDTLHDVIPLTGALRNVITLSSQCHSLMAPTQAISSSPSSPPTPPAPCAPTPLSSAMGVSQHSDTSLQGYNPPPAPSPPSTHRRPPAAPRHLSPALSVKAISSGGNFSVIPKDEGDQVRLLLQVSSKDLRYRGEGAEHIVLRVLTSGQVLRIRKTPVGATSPKKDLVIRAKKDEEFLHNVARPILGPLLTDESRLVCLDASTVQELRDTLAPMRQANRRHKEINNEGVACICPDAASIFISRRSTLTSSSGSSNSSPTSPRNLPSPLLSPDVIVSSSSWSGVLNEQVVGKVPDTQCNGQDIHLMPMTSLLSRDNSQGAKAEKNLRNNQPSSTSSLPNDLYPVGFENGSYSEFKSILEDCPMSSPYSAPSLSVIREPQNVCIEIKPKQGFIDTSTPELPLCRYCVKQFIKVGKDADPVTSCYCPLDLFSGNLARMRKAVDGLLKSPQNNFKVFVDGEPVDNCLSFRYLRDIIIAALTYDFRKSKVELHENGPLSPCSPLGRTLAFQKLDKLGVYRAANLYRYLVKIMGHSKAADALLQDLKCWTGDSQFCQANSKFCTRCFQEAFQEINGVSDVSCRSFVDNDSQENKDKVFNDPSRKNVSSEHVTSNRKKDLKPILNQEHSLSITNIKTMPEHIVGGESFMQDDIIRKLQEYLLSTTAKDLSLMILLSGPHKSTPVPSNTVNSSPFIIELEDGIWYRCQVTGVDLVAKPPSKILKHEQDYLCLKSVLEDLQRKGKKPSCCN